MQIDICLLSVCTMYSSALLRDSDCRKLPVWNVRCSAAISCINHVRMWTLWLFANRGANLRLRKTTSQSRKAEQGAEKKPASVSTAAATCPTKCSACRIAN